MTTTDRIYVPDLSADEQDSLDELVAQWRSKRRRNNLRSGLYDMKNATSRLISSSAPPVVKRRSFVLEWPSLAVDKLARRCNLDNFYDASGVDLDALGMPEIIEGNRLTAEVHQAGISSLLHAVSWVITTQGDTSAGEPAALVTMRDALTGTGKWDSRRRRLRSFLSLTDLDSEGEPVGMVMYLPNLNLTMTKDAGRWLVDRRSHVYGVPVDPLRFKPRIGRPFGQSRLTRSVMSLHEQALAAMIRADVNGEAYSLPRYVLLGATESAFQNADGSVKPTWQAAWDAIWAIGDDDNAPDGMERADVKQFTGQSPEPQNAHLRMLAQMFSGTTGIPIGELGIIGDSNPTSHEAMLASRDDIIATAETAMDDWTPDLSSAAMRALRIQNGDNVPDDLDVRPLWRPPQHVSRAAAADAGQKILTQVPWLAETEVGLELLGLSPDQITRAMGQRRRAQGTQVLDSLRSLATGQTAATAAPVADEGDED